MAISAGTNIVETDLIYYFDPANKNSYNPDSSLSNPTTWTAASATAAVTWRSICYGNGKFVAFADSGTAGSNARIMYSTNGINWTQASYPGSAKYWKGVVWGKDKFVAVSATGAGDGIMYSYDGITWVLASEDTDKMWYGVTYGNGRFVAVAWDTSSYVDTTMYSDDGITWEANWASTAGSWTSVTYGIPSGEDVGKFVAVSNNGKAMYSTNGINWTTSTPATTNTWRSVTYGNGRFVAVAFTGNAQERFMYSTNGTTWSDTDVSTPATQAWFGVTYDGKNFIAVGYGTSDDEIIYSSDGITWTGVTEPEENEWYAIAYGNGMNVAVSFDGTNQVMYSDVGNKTITNMIDSNTYTSTITGAVFDSDGGGSILLDGSDDCVELSGTSSLNYPISTSVTLSVFVKFNSVGDWQGLITKNRSTSTYLGLYLSNTDKAGLFAHGSTLYGDTTLTTDTWYHIVGVQLADTSRKIYINGVLDGTQTSTFGTTPSGTENWMLGQATGATQFLDGKMGNAMIYNKALSEAEVKQNYNTLKRRFGL